MRLASRQRPETKSETETGFKRHVDGRGGVNGISSWRQLWQENIIHTYCVGGRRLLYIETEGSVNNDKVTLNQYIE